MEIIFQICEPEDDGHENVTSEIQPKSSSSDLSVSSIRRWTLSDVKRKITGNNKKEKYKGLCLKITTSKMRCSIKVKEEFENVAGKLHI